MHSKPDRYSLEKDRLSLISSVSHQRRMSSAGASHPPTLLPPIPLDQLHWNEPPERFNARTVRRISRPHISMGFESLRRSVSELSNPIRQEMSIDITHGERSRVFGHSGGWAQVMTTRHLHKIMSPHPVARGRRRFVESEGDKGRIQFGLNNKPKMSSIPGRCY
jgi:hypothetical protein